MFEDDTTQVNFLKKALYDLKQSLKIWYQTLLDLLCKFEFYKTKTNHSLCKNMFTSKLLTRLLQKREKDAQY